MAKVKTANAPKTQEELDTLFKLAISVKDGNAIEKIAKLMDRGEIHFPPNSQRPVLGAAPKVEQAVDAAENLPTGLASKKKLTAADRADMAAAEERAKKAAAAQKAADAKALEELQAQRAADEAKKAAAAPAPEEPKAPKAEEPKAPTAKKSTSSRPSKPTVPSAGKKTPGLVPVRTRETALERTPSPAPRTPAAGVEVEKPSRQEQRARIEGIKKGAATRAVASREGNPVKLSDIQKNIEEGDIKGAAQKLGGHNFKQAFRRLPSETRNKLLTQAFGSNLSGLNTAQINQLGEMAMAQNVLKKLGLTEMPEFQRLDKGVLELADQIKGAKSGELAKSGIDKRIQALHGGLLTGEGKIRTEVMRLPSEEKGVRRETALRRQRDAEAAAKKEARRMSTIPATGGEKKKTAPKKGLVDVPELGTEKPTTPAPAVTPSTVSPEKAAAPVTAVPNFETAPTTAATPTTIGKENAAKLKQMLDGNNIEEKTLLAQINKAGKGKKGFVPIKNLEDIPADLQPRVDAWVAKTAAKRGGPAVAAASSAVPEFSGTAAPTAPVKPSAAKSAAPTGTLADILGPTKMGAPTAPAAAPTAASAPAAPAATGAVEKKVGPWKKGAMRSGLGARKGAEAVKQRLGQITGGAGAGGAMRFLGPLFGAFAAYQLLDMARQGTVGEADQRRMKALEALSGVSGGMQQDAASREQMRQMQRMVDLAAIQRQQSLDQMRQQYTGDQALDAILRGQQSSLAALAVPSQPSIAEMMARY